MAGEVGRALGPAARGRDRRGCRPPPCGPARSGARSAPNRRAGRSAPRGRSRRRPGRRCGPRTRCRARPADGRAANSASAGARWAMPKESGAVSRIGPATWVTASATTSSPPRDRRGCWRRAGIIGLADVGRLGALRGPGQQPRAELLLEPGDPAGEDRLGQPHPLGRAGEGAGLHHPDEGEDVEQIGRGAFHRLNSLRQ